MPSNLQHTRRGRLEAFTLVEILVAVALLAMILAAIALATQGAVDAVDYGAEKSRSLTSATLALNRLSSDLRQAADIQTMNSHTIAIRLPDDTVHTYFWNGVSGQPLWVSYTSDADSMLVSEVADFTVTVTTDYSDVTESVVPVGVHVVLETIHGDTSTRIESSSRMRRNIM